MLNPVGYPQMQMQPPQPMHPHLPQHGSSDFSFNETIGLPQPGHLSAPPHDPNDYGRAMSNPPLHDFVPRSGPHPTGQSGEFIPRTSARQLPTIRGNMPPYDNRTMTAQRYKRRPPMWVVAALSCSIALLIAGVVIAVISSPSPPKATTGSTTPTAAAGATGSGPFASARAAFNGIVNQPGSSLVPPGAPPSAVTAPPLHPTAAAVSAEPPAVAAALPAATTAAAAPVVPVAVAPPAPPSPPPAAPVAAPPPATTPRPAAPPSTAAPAPPPATAAKPSKPAALGALTVVCMPKCDQITDNGVPLGPGHIFNRPVPSGRHVLQLSAPNGAKKSLVVEVSPEQTKEVRMSMDK